MMVHRDGWTLGSNQGSMSLQVEGPHHGISALLRKGNGAHALSLCPIDGTVRGQPSPGAK